MLSSRSAFRRRTIGAAWTNYESVDFFTDESLIEDPYPYFEHLRAKCPVVAMPHYGVVAVSGYDEATEIYRNIDTFSSCNSVVGPFATFPVPLEGDDVSAIIDRHRDQLPMNEHMVTMDPPMHTRERALLMRLLTPKRLKENEAFMRRAVDQQLDEFIGDGHCEFISAYAQPFAMLVVADVLGVPEADHQTFRQFFGLATTPGEISGRRGQRRADSERANSPSTCSTRSTTGSPRTSRTGGAHPRHDVLTDLALAKYPDGSTPEVAAVVRTATFLFAAGQETTARLLATGAQVPGRVPRAPGRAPGAPRPHPRLHRRGAADREPGEGRLPAGPTGGHRRRRRHRTRYAGHVAERSGQPGPAAVRVPGRVPHRPARTPRSTWPSGGEPIPAPAVPWPGPRAASASSASSTGCGTSGSPRSTTGRRGTATSSTSRPGSSAASTTCTSSSRPMEASK